MKQTLDILVINKRIVFVMDVDEDSNIELSLDIERAKKLVEIISKGIAYIEEMEERTET